jgi:hypothetical protein
MRTRPWQLQIFHRRFGLLEISPEWMKCVRHHPDTGFMKLHLSILQGASFDESIIPRVV